MVASSVSAGTDMTCATVRGGRVWCWGSNDRGQLGDGTTRASGVPVQVAYIDDALTVTAGGTWTSGGMGAGLSAFACAWLRDQTLDCWGNEFGWLAGDTFSGSSPVPQPLIGASGVTSLAAGNWHLCTLSSGTVSCWGWDRGQLGQTQSSTVSPPEPVRVPGITDAVAISAHGSDFTCAVMADASVECWGTEWGPSGLINDPTPVTIPGVVASPSGLAVGFNHACAVSTAGSPVQCWGLNSHGELGDGTANASATPVTVQGLDGLVTSLAAGSDQTCAVLSDGHVQCWGGGVLGNGTLEGSPLPVTVNGITDAVEVSAGYGHTCARTSAGRILCWGDNSYGQLGNGDTSRATNPTPTAVTGF
jgi:alpha-tubulin suppressor-like RCC1 family protein